MAGLTAKQQRFVDEYIIDMNATQAAIRAGYSQKTAKQQGQRLLTKVDVAVAVDRKRGRLVEKTDVTAERVVLELAKVAFLDVTEAFDDEGNLRPLSELPDHVRAAIAGVETRTELLGEECAALAKVQKLKVWDKVKALDLLGKHFGLWAETVVRREVVFVDLSGGDQRAREIIEGEYEAA